ncbi:class I SAM-dependent methyltransferase [Luteimonas saliphila]|uniref:class I SAM-dependent methyltransferase n=1 Tax=Luteimonas saliphila TaxID=2804919 RepID=UPI00192E1D73|nr:class I SAM-dependent methyltransferase [Luteimonas saliphila]
MTQPVPGVAPKTHGLALDMKPGDEHYRAYVGPPRDYDLVSAMVFNLLTCTGLRQHHRVLDIGCGSLRVGRLLIPYLNAGHYTGIEPNRWLVEDGIANEVGSDLVRIKQPVFSFRDSLDEFQAPLAVDVAVAQSIFSHCGHDLLRQWLSQVSAHLAGNGALFATFLVSTQDFAGTGWVYPGCVKYRPETLEEWAAECGLRFRLLDWFHPRQQWALFSRPGYDASLIDGGPISWNRLATREGR